MPRRADKHYGEHDSPFFRLRSRAKLAKLLYVGRPKLESLARAERLYYRFEKPKASGGVRVINAPRADLKAVQSRIADLLHRIAPPDYLFAPVSGRSYVDNAAAHLGAKGVRLLDIEDFFPRCRANKVVWFLQRRMQTSADVAAVITGVVTLDGSFPQGSPCSPILAYLCYVDMWEEISRIVERAGCTLSVYADDLTISGRVVPEAAIWDVKQALFRHGHRYQAAKERSKCGNFSAEITGVVLTPDGLRVPNRLHQQLHEARRALKRTRCTVHRTALDARVRGREAQMRQITSANRQP